MDVTKNNNSALTSVEGKIKSFLDDVDPDVNFSQALGRELQEKTQTLVNLSEKNKMDKKKNSLGQFILGFLSGAVILAVVVFTFLYFNNWGKIEQTTDNDNTKIADDNNDSDTEIEDTDDTEVLTGKNYELIDGTIYYETEDTQEPVIVEEIAEAHGEGNVAELITNNDSGWLTYRVFVGYIQNVGGENIGEIYDWYVYNENFAGMTRLNDREVTMQNYGITFTVNRAYEWINDHELIVGADGGMTLNGIAVYDAQTDSFRDLTQEEMDTYGYSGYFGPM